MDHQSEVARLKAAGFQFYGLSGAEFLARDGSGRVLSVAAALAELETEPERDKKEQT